MEDRMIEKTYAKPDMTEVFGSHVFNDRVMRERLPKDTLKELRKCLAGEISLSPELADVIANAMKDWAIERGATHYTHWFHPLTGTTAEKHDSFISPTDDGGVIMEFSGKQLTQGEPDASSFPSGGLRATFEARGYTAWDITSPAFLKEDSAGNLTLTIPTAFCSYNGQALDKKTPLLRSMRAVSEQAMRVLRALGNKTAKKVVPTVGPEQEYFLIDREYFLQRLDLITSGRTLFGAQPPKGQELEDHYFGSIKDRISEFMVDLDNELWKMGITSKTKHNEVAPGQYEMAPIFATTNIATDHNQLVMETMQKVALRHNLVCLLHEKPFAGINGSGKHNNWSLATDDGMNLLDPGHTPSENQQFLIFLSALIRAIDRHADILRATAASTGNDHRLGANEAPPAIISIFLGEELSEMFSALAKGVKYESRGQSYLKVGVDTLPSLPKDNSDRNRTSPFAFTGNKFEFRMVGSSASIAGPNVAINTIVAEVLDGIANRLEKAADKAAESQAIIREIANEHHRVIFNGNGYSREWVLEAEKRGLPNIRNTVDALKAFVSERSLTLFEKYRVLTREEMHSRYEIYVEQYAKQINIEGRTAVNMCHKQYIPAVLEFVHGLAETVTRIKQAGAYDASISEALLGKALAKLSSADSNVRDLEAALDKAAAEMDVTRKAEICRDEVVVALFALRMDIDALEAIMPKDLWPVPSYEDMLFKL